MLARQTIVFAVLGATLLFACAGETEPPPTTQHEVEVIDTPEGRVVKSADGNGPALLLGDGEVSVMRGGAIASTLRVADQVRSRGGIQPQYSFTCFDAQFNVYTHCSKYGTLGGCRDAFYFYMMVC